MAKTRKIGRSATTGRFISVKTAQSRKRTTVVESLGRKRKK